MSVEDSIVVFVTVTIPADKEAEFKEVMAADVTGSRAEAGCLRFDLMRDLANPNRFFFYEVYVDADAVDVHKAQPHFKLWSDFKASGGVIKSVSTKASFPGWGLQE